MNKRKLVQVLMPDLPEYVEEGEFFIRELELIGKKVNHEDAAPLPINSLIYCNNLKHWENRLKHSEKSSVSVIIAANEYYSPERWILLNNFESIRCAFIQYLPSSRRSGFGSIIKFILRSPQILRQKAFWGTIKSASRSYLGIKRLHFKVPVYPFPLGYTERFALEMRKLGLISSNTGSLFKEKYYEEDIKRVTVSFTGQKGTWYRRLMVDFFEQIASANTSKYSSFGGFTTLPETTGYTESILNSRFVICPPGNVSSQSFRYYEAIALGAIPIVSEVSIQDWNTHDYWPQNIPWKGSHFMDVWLSLNAQTPQALERLSQDLRMKISDELALTKKRIRSYTSEDRAHYREDSVN